MEDQLTKVISLLPDIATMQAQLHAGERSGEKVSNTLVLEVIKKEQEAINRERNETRNAMAALKTQLNETPTLIPSLSSTVVTDLQPTDTEKLESAIKQVAAKQHGAAVEQAELAELKQEIREYKDVSAVESSFMDYYSFKSLFKLPFISVQFNFLLTYFSL